MLRDTRKQVLDPMTAYQVTSMLRGVSSVERRTGCATRRTGRGQTGPRTTRRMSGSSVHPDAGDRRLHGIRHRNRWLTGETGGGLAAPTLSTS